MKTSVEMLWKKVRTDKKLMLTVLLAGAAVLLLLLSEICTSQGKKSSEVSDTQDYRQELDEYSARLEKRVEQLVTSIDGAGRTQVLITLECGLERVYAKNSRDSAEKSADSALSEERVESEGEYILVDGDAGDEGLALKTVQPIVRGVAVVCEGADSPAVRMDVTQCVCAALGVNTAHVSVTKMKTEGEQ